MKKWDRGGRGAVGDDVTSRSVKTFQFDKVKTLKKRNHPAEALVRRGRRKALYRRERDSLQGPHKEAEIQRKALTRGKNLTFSEDTCLEKERVQSKMTSRKVGMELKRKES